jgi:hypothetical protein
MLHHVLWFITLMMLAVSTSETWANFYQTTLSNIPEDGLIKYENFQIL